MKVSCFQNMDKMKTALTKADVVNHWQVLHIDPQKLKADAGNLHQAVQLVAMAGKYFITETADDSHTASSWIAGKSLQLGGQIHGGKQDFMVGLSYPDFALQLLRTDLEIITAFPLNGKTFAEAFQWLWNQLKMQELNAIKLLPKMHFDIPDHPIKHGNPFRIESFEYLQELARHRTNGHLLHQYFQQLLHRDEDVLIWPHHFDEGLYLPLTFDGEAPTSSISFGLSMPDIYYPEPYFYVTAWEKEEKTTMKDLKLSSLGHWHRQDWLGQVLETHFIVQAGTTVSEQAGLGLSFLQQAINNALKMVGKNQEI